MNLRFDEALWFAGLLLIVPVALLTLRWFSAMSGPRKGTVLVFRAGLLAVLLALLAGATFVRETMRLAVVGVVDVSGSVRSFYRLEPGESGQERTIEQVASAMLAAGSKGRKPEDVAGVVVFGAEPVAAQALGSTPVLVPSSATSSDGTDIERALRLAGAMLPPDAVGRIVLFSDGVSTSGRPDAALKALAASGSAARRIPVDVVPLSYRVERETAIESVDAPPTATAGATVAVRVVINSTLPTAGELRLLREGSVLDINGEAEGFARMLTVPAGRHVEVINVPLPAGRVHRFEAVWEPAGESDTIARNNAAEAFTITPGKGSVLIVDGVSGGTPGTPGDALAQALRSGPGGGMDVRTVGPEGLKADLLFLQQFDLVILHNVSAESVPRDAHATLASAVTTLGTGLIMVGGPDSFGAGGWKGTALEPILPVKLDLPVRLITPAAALVLVIDNSGSMNRAVLGSTKTQQQIANEGAAIAVESLDKTDLVGVITFNSSFTVDVRLSPNSTPKETGKRIRAISADGGTFLPPALAEAQRQLMNAKADVKHIIVLSDGVSQGAEQLAAMAEAAGRSNIRVSTVAIGDGADVDVMRDMATAGNGEFYRVIDPTLLPRVLLKAVRIVRTPQVREQTFIPALLPTGTPVLEGLEGNLPTLHGLVLTQARPERTIVYPLVTPSLRDAETSRDGGGEAGGEPVLAYWNVGIGRVGAFTSDANPQRWARSWVGGVSGGAGGSDPTFARFWLQFARSIARPSSTGERTQQLTIEHGGMGAGIGGGGVQATATGQDRMTIRLEVSSEPGEEPASGPAALTVSGTLYMPDSAAGDGAGGGGGGGGGGSKAVPITLEQVGPGVYETVVKAQSPGTYIVTLAPKGIGGAGGAGGVSAPVIGGVSVPSSTEYRRLMSDEAAMREIADRTGGRVLALDGPAPDLFDRTGLSPAEARLPLTRILLFAAVTLVLLDVATRRIAWDRLFSKAFGAELAREAAAAMQDRTVQAREAVARLKKSDEGVSEAMSAQGAATLATLGDEDAARIRAEQAERRRKAREAARRGPAVPEPATDAAAGQPTADAAGAPAASSASPPSVINESTPPATSGEAEEPGGLLAAKRRARQKMDDRAG